VGLKQGSINLAFESERMAIPKAKFIGRINLTFRKLPRAS
jgi:DNA topoisomerase VI subunit A